jgi:hypothetical protein
MFDDFKKLLSVFNAHSVKYLVVGGYAVSFHAQPRATKDLDLFLKADPANAKATYAALASFASPRGKRSIHRLNPIKKDEQCSYSALAVSGPFLMIRQRRT